MVVLIITGALAIVFFLIAFKKAPSSYSFINEGQDTQTISPNPLPDEATPTCQTSKNKGTLPSQPTNIQNINPTTTVVNPTTVLQTQSTSPTPTLSPAASLTPTTIEKTKDKNTVPIYSSG